MPYQVTAMIRVKDGESGYRIVSETKVIKGNKLVTPDQLYELFKKIAEGKKLLFEYIVFLKIIQLQDEIQIPQLPVEKKASAR
jgi:hypothetical protein